MNVNSMWILLVFALSASLSLHAVTRYQDQDLTATLREVRDSVNFLRHEIQNHDAEIKMFDERVNNQDSALASMRQQIQDANLASKESMKGNLTTLEAKLSNLEATNKGLVEDMRSLRKHANEATTALAQSKQRVAELEKTLALQSQTLDHMQEALGSLMEALQLKDGVYAKSTGEGKRYRIRAGDSLEKIARAHRTSVKEIKELNHLSTDEIVAGKMLNIP